MTDRTTKALLVAIALGLWMNVATQWVKPAVVHAQDDSRIVNLLQSINSQLSSFHCKGELKTSVWGAATAGVGGYEVDVTCK